MDRYQLVVEGRRLRVEEDVDLPDISAGRIGSIRPEQEVGQSITIELTHAHIEASLVINRYVEELRVGI